MKIDFNINGKAASVNTDPDMPLLWVVRDELGLKATKYGCGKALCGACSLHIDGEVVRSCSFPVQYAAGKKIITLEGLSANEENLHPIQQAWIDENVPQCGYCQPGFMMALMMRGCVPQRQRLLMLALISSSVGFLNCSINLAAAIINPG